jgi:hypothetical protein
MAKSSLSLLVKDGKAITPNAMSPTDGQNASYTTRKIIKAPPIGAPPGYFNDLQRAVWREIAASMPWLRENHRITVELYAVLTARFRDDPLRFSSKDASVLMKCSDRLGGNPISDQFFASHDHDAPKDEFLD